VFVFTMPTPTQEKTMRAPRGAFAWATAAALMAGAAPAMAAEPGKDTLPINVIAIQTNDADDQAEALTKALRGAVRAIPGWSLGEGDYSLEVLTLSLKCAEPPDANCQSRIADQIKSDRYVWGTIKKKAGIVRGEVHLWVRGKGTSNQPIEYSANLTEANDESLKKIAADAISNLTGGPPKGGVHVRAGNVPGQVFLDGQPIGALKAGDGTFMVPSGPHRLTVKAVGFAESESQIVVKPTGAPAEVNVSLVSVGGGGTTNLKRIGGYVSLGAGVAFGVVGIVSALQVKNAQDAIESARKGVSSSVDVCTTNTSIANACSKGKTFQTTQIIFFPLAAVAGGLGIYLVATSGKSAPKTGFMVNPQVGPGGGKLDLTYTF
jgi:hypothetical protein